MPVNIKLNQNEAMSSAYGKYYLEVATSEVLSTEGLVNHITHHNCAVGTEAIAAVIKKLGECVPELVAQGQPSGHFLSHGREQEERSVEVAAAGFESESAGRAGWRTPTLPSAE